MINVPRIVRVLRDDGGAQDPSGRNSLAGRPLSSLLAPIGSLLQQVISSLSTDLVELASGREGCLATSVFEYRLYAQQMSELSEQLSWLLQWLHNTLLPCFQK